MYHYLEDKQFLKDIRRESRNIMQTMCHYLKEDYDISAIFCLVGSGGRNLVLQNGNEPVDLDYNLQIVKCADFEDCRYIKECARKSFNKALKDFQQCDCEDSTSSLTSKKMRLNGHRIAPFFFTQLCGPNLYTGKDTYFSIDICIIKTDKSHNNYERLIHEKTGWTSSDRYYWNKGPKSKQLKEKAKCIKSCGKWELVRQQYLTIKNRYLRKNDTNHPSFICYAEAVNNVYNGRNNW